MVREARVLLVNLPSFFLDNDRVFPTLGPLYLKSFLESKGIEVGYTDSLGHRENNNLVLDERDNDLISRFDVIGISATTPQSSYAREVLKHSKNLGKMVVTGGPHATNYTLECITKKIFKKAPSFMGEMN